MTRYILCEGCCGKLSLHPEDAAVGFKQRRVEIVARKPVSHFMTVTTGVGTDHLETTREEIPHLICDSCSNKINDGSPAIAVTIWRGEEPSNWEQEYSHNL